MAETITAWSQQGMMMAKVVGDVEAEQLIHALGRRMVGAWERVSMPNGGHTGKDQA